MSSITQPTNFSTIPPDQVPQYLEKFASNVVSVVNGGLDFSNFNFQMITVNFPLVSVQYGFPHSLGKVPTGYIRYGGNFNGPIWENTTRLWTPTMIYLLAGSIGYAKLILF